jgi:hypothetical protein
LLEISPGCDPLASVSASEYGIRVAEVTISADRAVFARERVPAAAFDERGEIVKVERAGEEPSG